MTGGAIINARLFTFIAESLRADECQSCSLSLIGLETALQFQKRAEQNGASFEAQPCFDNQPAKLDLFAGVFLAGVRS